MLLGAIVGLERESTGQPAGVRTYMLVALASALFVIVPLELGLPLAEVARIAQGVATGIGFIGAGAILKLSADREIQGLTTAAAIWMTAAVGMTVGFGGFGIAALSLTLAWFILAIIGRITKYLDSPTQRASPVVTILPLPDVDGMQFCVPRGRSPLRTSRMQARRKHGRLGDHRRTPCLGTRVFRIHKPEG
ncbi:MgtC/SapB family protein [Thiocapsa sp.]|uniref:MgtC/SapB family protein n=1 Tax=Thiocapsa sp. TaxID=2024551 RepID=UPI0035935678